MPCFTKIIILICYKKKTKKQKTKKTTLLMLPKNYLKLNSPKCSSFWLRILFLCLFDVLFNGQSEILWVPTVRLSDVFLYEAGFIQGHPENDEKNDVLSLNNSMFCNFVNRIYNIDIEIKDTTDTARFTSYFDLIIEIDSEGPLKTKLYDKSDEFPFHHCECCQFLWIVHSGLLLRFSVTCVSIYL